MKRPTRKQLIAATFEHSPGAKILDIGGEMKWVAEAPGSRRHAVACGLLGAYAQAERLRTRLLFYEHEGRRAIRYGTQAQDFWAVPT